MSLRYLLDRLRHPRSRADQLARLRARFAAQPGRWQVDRRAVELARELRTLRVAMHAQLGRVELCASCAKGHPLPAGRWAGGHCCGGETLAIFTPAEVMALKLGGTRTARWQAPQADHAGCAFRGPTGCSLAPAHRPTICLRYICADLRQQLKRDGRWPPIVSLNRQLGLRFAELVRHVGAEPPAAPFPFTPDGAPASSGAPRGP